MGVFPMSIDFFTGSRFFCPKACNFSKRRDRTHTRCQKERVPEEAEIGVLPMSIDFFTGSRFFPKACNFSKRRDRTHTRCQKERVPEEAEIGVLLMSIDFFTGSRFSQKHATFLKEETERIRGPKNRGSLRRPKLACPRRALTFLHVHKAPELPGGLLTRILDFDPTPLP